MKDASGHDERLLRQRAEGDAESERMNPICSARKILHLIVLLLSLAPAGCGRREDPRFANPKAAARTLFQAMYDNDVATAKSCVIAGPGQTELVTGMTAMMGSMHRAMDAAYKRYGDE